jgi:three-Cys-motif partner protein
MTAQKFGGPWTVLKIETLAAYLQRFCTALQAQPTPSRPFRRIYIDGFAGSGGFEFGKATHGFFPTDPSVHAGSPIRALETKPPLDELHFIESDKTCLSALRQAVGQDPRVKIHDGDANEIIQKICAETNWARTRGVIFLDPFGASVIWETLEAIRATEALDLWYLFPIASIFRNAPIDSRAMTDEKRTSISRILGTDDWERAFYPEIEHPRQGLLGALPAERRADVRAIETYVKELLASLFPSVIGPLTIRTPKNAPLFSLFFAVSNPRPTAIAVANRIAGHLLKKK